MYKNAEKNLMQDIQDTIEERYIESLVDKYTNLIIGDVHTVLTYLFCNYSKVRSNEVSQKEAEVMLLR